MTQLRKKQLRRTGVTATAALAVSVWAGLFGVELPISSSASAERTAGPAAVAAALTGSKALRAAYWDWAAQHEHRGGDRNVRFPLASTEQLAHDVDAGAQPLGIATLDLIAGSFQIQIRGLSGDAPYAAWLLDNRPGEGNSLRPDASDRYLELGELERSDEGWILERRLGEDRIADFPVDAVLIAPAGADPQRAAVMSGTPDLFQRIYSATRTPQLMAASDYPSFIERASTLEILGTRAARAARKNPPQAIVVDPDILIDDLVALGADLFINEDFEGNGRTCETCHDFLNNNTIDPPFISRLPDNDPLFIAEQIPGLASDGTNVGALDIPEVLRATALVGIAEDGIDKRSVNRAVPHLKGLRLTSAPPVGVFQPFSDQNPAPFPLPPGDAVPPGAQLGITLDNASVPPFDRGGFGGDLSFEPELGLFGNIRDAVPGAIFLLFTKTLDRQIGVDFRLPTDLEADAVTAFYFTLGRSSELTLPIPLSDPIAARGQLAFMNDGGATHGNPPGRAQVIPLLDDFGNPIGAGKCNICHFNAGALANPVAFQDVEIAFARQLGLPDDQRPAIGLTNMNFETGAERLPSQPADLVAADKKARDAGFGRLSQQSAGDTPACRGGRGGFGGRVLLDFPGTDPPILAGDCSEAFSTQPLIEVADTPPFFHNNAVTTIETAVSFYNSDAFNGSQGARILGAITGTNGIKLSAPDVQSIAGFLRALNALDNIDFALSNLTATSGQSDAVFQQLVDNALAETTDAIDILEGAFINPRASTRLREGSRSLQEAKTLEQAGGSSEAAISAGVAALTEAREMISPGGPRIQ